MRHQQTPFCYENAITPPCSTRNHRMAYYMRLNTFEWNKFKTIDCQSCDTIFTFGLKEPCGHVVKEFCVLMYPNRRCLNWRHLELWIQKFPGHQVRQFGYEFFPLFEYKSRMDSTSSSESKPASICARTLPRVSRTTSIDSLPRLTLSSTSTSLSLKNRMCSLSRVFRSSFSAATALSSFPFCSSLFHQPKPEAKPPFFSRLFNSTTWTTIWK